MEPGPPLSPVASLALARGFRQALEQALGDALARAEHVGPRVALAAARAGDGRADGEVGVGDRDAEDRVVGRRRRSVSRGGLALRGARSGFRVLRRCLRRALARLVIVGGRLEHDLRGGLVLAQAHEHGAPQAPVRGPPGVRHLDHHGRLGLQGAPRFGAFLEVGERRGLSGAPPQGLLDGGEFGVVET